MHDFHWLNLSSFSGIFMRTLFFSLLFITAHFLQGQNHVDSIAVLLKAHERKDAVHVSLLNELSARILEIDPEQSLRYASGALTLSRHLSYPEGLGEATNNLAAYHLMIGNADSAAGLAFEALKIGEQEQLAGLAANACVVLGTVYRSQSDDDKALHYFRRARRLNLQAHSVRIESKILIALGTIAKYSGNYDSALFYYKSALAIVEGTTEDYRVPEVINQIGTTYSANDRMDVGVKYYIKALEAARKHNNLRMQSAALGNLGSVYLSDKRYKEAEKVLLESIALKKKMGDSKNLSNSYMMMMQLKNETGRFNEAHKYMASYYMLKDSLLSAGKIKKIAELETRYETQKKEHAIQLLERDKKIQSLWKNILIVSLVLLAIASFVIYYVQRFRDRKNRTILNLEIERLTTQHHELSEKYKNVFTTGEESSVESHDQRVLKKVIEIVEAHMSDPSFNVEMMAREIGMSRTSLHRKIKAITGFPPSELIRSIRLRKAAMLLLNQADSVSQISMIVGFEDHSYFSKLFKKQFGVRPSDYFLSRSQANG
jgi:AraC-like DNA-binding protein